ncbi:class I SAM-dependent methyltransferase [Actinophytocola sediminis]
MTVEAMDSQSGGGVPGIFNSAVAAFAISAAWELGALDELRVARVLNATDFARRNALDHASTVGMFRALASVHVVERNNVTITRGRHFEEVYRNRSFFHWLSRGSAELFREMPSVMREENRFGRFYRRDPAAIAYACREINDICYDPTFLSVLGELDFEFTTVVDLGCGSGGRLMNILDMNPDAVGVGVDIAQPSLEVARKEAADAGLGDRLTFVQGDVLRLDPDPQFEEAELITSFMMGHDFWPRENCVDTLRRLRGVFPNARRFLLGDATRTAGIPDAALPSFTLAFEVGHDLMGTFIPTIADWESVFEDGGWELVRTNRIELAAGEVIFELA